jgi:hypothetical protein
VSLLPIATKIAKIACSKLFTTTIMKLCSKRAQGLKLFPHRSSRILFSLMGFSVLRNSVRLHRQKFRMVAKLQQRRLIKSLLMHGRNTWTRITSLRMPKLDFCIRTQLIITLMFSQESVTFFGTSKLSRLTVVFNASTNTMQYHSPSAMSTSQSS